MDNSSGLISILALLGAAQGVFLALALLSARNGDTSAHRLLALLTFLFALDLGEEFLFQSGFFHTAPNLLQILAPIDLLYGPLIYLYVVQLTSPGIEQSLKGNYWHFLPVLTGIVFLLPFYLLDGGHKLELTVGLRKGGEIDHDIPHAMLIQLGLTLFILGTILQIGVYLLASIKRLKHHSVSIRNEFSDIDRINLLWLRNLLLGLGCIFVFYLGDQFFPDLMGMNILGDAITVIAVILIYTMGYLGLRQPVIFTSSSQSAFSASRANTRPSEEKYNRSGLDKETSLVFLDELTRHMEANEPYLEGDLVLPQLAQQLGISANYLSQIINEQLNVNFYDFVNGYRVEKAKRFIRKAGKKKPNILNITLESGFNSKSSFYTAFRKATSMTPTQYRKTLKSPIV